MANLMPSVDKAGNINVHSRDSVLIPIREMDGETQRDLSSADLFFETASGFRKALGTDPSNPLGRRIEISPTEHADFPPDVEFIVVDETGTMPVVLWEGRFIRRIFG